MMRPYTKEDFIKIRDFLADTYAHFQRPFNWLIERWNVSPSLAREMNGVSLEEWESQIGIWEDANRITAVVNAEGEDTGEAFFQVAHEGGQALGGVAAFFLLRMALNAMDGALARRTGHTSAR